MNRAAAWAEKHRGGNLAFVLVKRKIGNSQSHTVPRKADPREQKEDPLNESGSNRPNTQQGRSRNCRPHRQPQQARCVCLLDGARQHGCPALEEPQLCGTAQNPRHRQWLEPSQWLEESDCFATPTPCHLERHHEKVAPVPVNQFVIPSLVNGPACKAEYWHTHTGQCWDNCDVNGQLLATPEWKAVRDDLDSALVSPWNNDVQVAEQLILLHTSACFPTHASHTNFRGGPSRFQEADPSASGSVMATHVQTCSASAESVIHVEGQVQTDEKQRAELFSRESCLRAGGKADEVPRSAWPPLWCPQSLVVRGHWWQNHACCKESVASNRCVETSESLLTCCSLVSQSGTNRRANDWHFSVTDPACASGAQVTTNGATACWRTGAEKHCVDSPACASGVQTTTNGAAACWRVSAEKPRWDNPACDLSSAVRNESKSRWSKCQCLDCASIHASWSRLLHPWCRRSWKFLPKSASRSDATSQRRKRRRRREKTNRSQHGPWRWWRDTGRGHQWSPTVARRASGRAGGREPQMFWRRQMLRLWWLRHTEHRRIWRVLLWLWRWRGATSSASLRGLLVDGVVPLVAWDFFQKVRDFSSFIRNWGGIDTQAWPEGQVRDLSWLNGIWK